MSIILGILFFGIFAWIVITVLRAQADMKNFFLTGLVMKCVAGICVGALYTYHYRTGDMLLFFSNASRLVSLAETDFVSYLNYTFTSEFTNNHSVSIEFSDKRAILMVKIVSLFGLLSFDNYWIVSVYMSVVSFLGAWFLVRQINIAFPVATAPALVAFLFFPSVTFWTSGLIKETLAMAGLYFLCGILIQFCTYKKITVVNLMFAAVSVFLLWSLKYYFAGILFAIAGATIIYRLMPGTRMSDMKGGWPYLLWAGILIFLVGGVTFLHPNFHVDRLLEVMVTNYDAFVTFSEPGTTIIFDNLEPTLTSMLQNSPKALFSGLFRPLFFDAHNNLAVLLSIENLALLVLSVIAGIHVRKIFSTNVSILLCAIVVYVILLAIFITLSTPNLGTLARYRVGYLPFFVFLILLAPPIVARLQKILTIPAKGN